MHPETIFDNRVDAARLDGAAAAVLGRDKTELELLEAFVAVDPSHEQVVVELTGDGALELVASDNEGPVLFDEGLGNTARPSRVRLDYARKITKNQNASKMGSDDKSIRAEDHARPMSINLTLKINVSLFERRSRGDHTERQCHEEGE